MAQINRADVAAAIKSGHIDPKIGNDWLSSSLKQKRGNANVERAVVNGIDKHKRGFAPRFRPQGKTAAAKTDQAASGKGKGQSSSKKAAPKKPASSREQGRIEPPRPSTKAPAKKAPPKTGNTKTASKVPDSEKPKKTSHKTPGKAASGRVTPKDPTTRKGNKKQTKNQKQKATAKTRSAAAAKNASTESQQRRVSQEKKRDRSAGTSNRQRNAKATARAESFKSKAPPKGPDTSADPAAARAGARDNNARTPRTIKPSSGKPTSLSDLNAAGRPKVTWPSERMVTNVGKRDSLTGGESSKKVFSQKGGNTSKKKKPYKPRVNKNPEQVGTNAPTAKQHAALKKAGFSDQTIARLPKSGKDGYRRLIDLDRMGKLSESRVATIENNNGGANGRGETRSGGRKVTTQEVQENRKNNKDAVKDAAAKERVNKGKTKTKGKSSSKLFKPKGAGSGRVGTDTPASAATRAGYGFTPDDPPTPKMMQRAKSLGIDASKLSKGQLAPLLDPQEPGQKPTANQLRNQKRYLADPNRATGSWLKSGLPTYESDGPIGGKGGSVQSRTGKPNGKSPNAAKVGAPKPIKAPPGADAATKAAAGGAGPRPINSPPKPGPGAGTAGANSAYKAAYGGLGNGAGTGVSTAAKGGSKLGSLLPKASMVGNAAGARILPVVAGLGTGWAAGELFDRIDTNDTDGLWGGLGKAAGQGAVSGGTMGAFAGPKGAAIGAGLGALFGGGMHLIGGGGDTTPDYSQEMQFTDMQGMRGLLQSGGTDPALIDQLAGNWTLGNMILGEDATDEERRALRREMMTNGFGINGVRAPTPAISMDQIAQMSQIGHDRVAPLIPQMSGEKQGDMMLAMQGLPAQMAMAAAPYQMQPNRLSDYIGGGGGMAMNAMPQGGFDEQSMQMMAGMQ